MKIRDEINGRLKDYISSQKKVTSEIALVQRRTIGRYSLNLISSLNPSVSLLQQLEAQVAKLFRSEVHIPLLTRIKERIKEERKKKMNKWMYEAIWKRPKFSLEVNQSHL